jgi:phospholipase C
VLQRALSVSVIRAVLVVCLALAISSCGGMNNGSSASPPPNPGSTNPGSTNPGSTNPGTNPGSNPGGGNPGGGTPAPGNINALNHIIFMFQENRSFDHYFAHLNSYRKANGWGGLNDVDTIDALTTVPSNPADASAPVRWASSNATDVKINGASAGATTGGMSVTPSTATLYTAVATSSTGETAQASVVIGTTPDAGARILVGASPMNVVPGGSSMLTWATTDGSSLTISPAPDPLHTQAYGPNASATVKAATTPGPVTYNFNSSSGLSASITLTVATPSPTAPTITITHNNQGHVSVGSAVNVQSFRLADQCVEDFSPDWLESHGAYNRDHPESDTWLGNGFVHITAGFSQFANSQDDHHHYFDVRGSRNMGYYDEAILPIYYFLASQFATSDRFFSPVPSNSAPNRFAELAATTAGYAHQPPQLDVKNIFQLLDNAGVTWKVYYSDVGRSTRVPLTTLTNFVWGAQHTDAKHLAPVDCTNPSTPCAAGQTDYFADLKSGNFPAVALIEPGFETGRDEHPGNPVQLGAVYDRNLIENFMNSPIWKDSVFFLTYDEAGGFYDHVQPMTAVQPDGIAPKDLKSKDPIADFTRTGFRMPLMVISPYVKPHFVSHQKSDTTAILRFIEQRFNLPNLTRRDAAQPDLDFFDFTKAAWATPPALPNQPADAPCAAYAKNP